MIFSKGILDHASLLLIFFHWLLAVLWIKSKRLAMASTHPSDSISFHSLPSSLPYRHKDLHSASLKASSLQPSGPCISSVFLTVVLFRSFCHIWSLIFTILSLKPNSSESSLLTTPFKVGFQGFPGGAVAENLPANAGDTGSSPGLGRSHMPRSN